MMTSQVLLLVGLPVWVVTAELDVTERGMDCDSVNPGIAAKAVIIGNNNMVKGPKD